jgi:hypothetical protein
MGLSTVVMTTAHSRNVAQISCAECMHEVHVMRLNMFTNSVSAYRAFATGVTYLTGIWNVVLTEGYRGFHQSLSVNYIEVLHYRPPPRSDLSQLITYKRNELRGF